MAPRQCGYLTINTTMNNPWTKFFEWAFGPAPAGTGQGVESTLDYVAPWATWVTVLLLVAATIFVLIIYAKERGVAVSLLGLRIPLSPVKAALALARWSLIAIVIFMLYEFALLPYRTELPDIVMMLDVSQSMNQGVGLTDSAQQETWTRRVEIAGFGDLTRWNLTRTLLLENDQRILRELQSRYRLRLYQIGGTARPADISEEETGGVLRDLPAADASSRLGRCLQSVLEAQRGRPTAAIVMMTDGITTEGRSIADVAPLAARREIPLFVLGLGSDEKLRDLKLSDLLVDEVVFVDDIMVFEAQVTGAGFEGRQAMLELHVDAQDRVLAQQAITIGPDGQSQRVRLLYQPKEEGEFNYELVLVPMDGEVTSENNLQSRLVSVRNDQINVLFVQAYPNYEFRYLKNMLARNESAIRLTTVLQEADADYASIDKTAKRVFPVQRDELFQYDVILFGDVNPSLLSTSVVNNIVDFVKVKGGGVLFISGPRYTPLAYRNLPLAGLLPVDLNFAVAPPPEDNLNEAYLMRPTELGLAAPQMQLGSDPAESLQIWRNLPPCYWLLEYHELKPGARILAEHPTHKAHDGRGLPIIAMQYVGAGKVVLHATEETWRWRYRAGDVFFSRYWVQTIRLLSRSKLWGKDRSMEITTDRNGYRMGELVRIRVRFLDDRLAPPEDNGVTVVLEQFENRSRHIHLRRISDNRGIFEGTVNHLPQGKYHLWIAVPTIDGNAPATDFTISAPAGEAARLKMDTVDLKQSATVSGGEFFTLKSADRLLARLPRGRQVKIESLEKNNIWNSWRMAVLFVAVIITEWLLRKKAGMV